MTFDFCGVLETLDIVNPTPDPNPDSNPHYPLGEHDRDELQAASGRKLVDITLTAVAAGELSSADLQIRAETLRAQAEISRQAGYTQLAENLTRAAELTVVPNDELLTMYETLRPGRATHAEMIALADRLEHHYHAPVNARLVREAARVYLERGLVKRAGS
jgi:propanediol dehydratase small subunit